MAVEVDTLSGARLDSSPRPQASGWTGGPSDGFLQASRHV